MSIELSDVTHAQRDVGLWIDLTLEGDQVERAPRRFDRRSTSGVHAADQCFFGEAVFDDLLDAAHADAVFGAQGFEIIHASHLAVWPDDFDDDGGGSQPSQFAQIDRPFGLSCSRQNATFAGAEWVDVAGTDEVVGAAGGIAEHLNRLDSVCGRNPRANTVPRVTVNAHGKRSGSKRCVHLRLWSEVESITILASHGDAQIPRADPCHEIDGSDVDMFGRDDEVALVLAALIVDEHNWLASTEIVENL
jgi:hypothetical protein